MDKQFSGATSFRLNMRKIWTLLSFICIFPMAYSQNYNLHVGEDIFLGIPFTNYVVTGSAQWNCTHRQIDARTDDKESGVIITVKQYFSDVATISVSWTEEYFNSNTGHSQFTSHSHTWTIRCIPVNINLAESNIDMKPGDTKRLNYSWSDQGWASAAQVEWVSSDPSIATVESGSTSYNSYAIITAKEPGIVTITANTNMGPSAVCNVTVKADGIEINQSVFPDDNFRNYLLGTNYGKDGILTETEIKGIETLIVQNKNISSLVGIELFSALKELNCSGNKLVLLDLSQNVYIESIYCDNNNISTLNVANNPRLKYLSCSNNQLNLLDLSKNTALQTIYCSSNRLSSLILSNKTALRDVGCVSCQLKSLDLSGCTALEELKCFNNQLTFLNLSDCISLGYIDCDNNQLTSLDVSKCNALSGLYCEHNQLISLNISSNGALKYLHCYCNNLSGSAMDALVNSLPQKSVEGNIFRVFDNTKDDENNVCTKVQVAEAKAKGWTPQYYNGTKWLEYEGSETSGVEGIVIDKQILSFIYSLSGQRLAAPKKGLNIINGRKVIVK